MIKVSRNVKSLARKIHFDREILTKKLGREPSVDELSEYAGIDKEDIVFAMESASGLSYLYDTIHQDDGSPVLLIDKLSENGEEDSGMINKIALKAVSYTHLDVYKRQKVRMEPSGLLLPINL